MNHRNIIDRWESRGAFAADIGVSPMNAYQMYHRNIIPARYWRRLVEAAKQRRIRLKVDELIGG